MACQKPLHIVFLHTAVLFFVLGVGLGMYMGITHDFRLTHVHVHINLLGWVALGLAGLIYAAFPVLRDGWLPRAHYWLHTLGLLVFMGGFASGVLRGEMLKAPVAIGATATSLGIVLFAVNVFMRMR